MKFKLLLIILAIGMLGACRSAPVMNVTEAPVVAPSGKAVTADNVRTAILSAGGRLGWQMSDAGPGVINARIALRTHTASADVKYNAKTYSIVYRESTGLDAKDGQIHKNYNGWIENLDREIRVELLRL
jgi:hypothetical protein